MLLLDFVYYCWLNSESSKLPAAGTTRCLVGFVNVAVEVVCLAMFVVVVYYLDDFAT